MGNPDQEQDEVVARLMARISELEQKVLQHELAQEEARAAAAAAAHPPKPSTQAATPRLGFLSAIRAGLRQLEESTGYSPTVYPPPPRIQSPPVQPPQELQLSGTPRIVYYQAPPKEVMERIHAHSGALTPGPRSVASVEPSHAGGGTSTTAEWIARLAALAPSWRSVANSAATPAAATTPAAPTEGGGSGELSRRPSCSGTAPDAPPGSVGAGQASQPPASTDTEGPQPVGVLVLDAAAGGSEASTPKTPIHTYRNTSLHVPGMQDSMQGGIASRPSVASSGDTWFSSLFKKSPLPTAAAGADTGQPHHTGPLPHDASSYNERALEMQLIGTEGSDAVGVAGDSHGRYITDPADVAAEMEVTARVRKAAAEALMAAEEKLRAAEATQASMQAQLQQSQDLAQEIERLRSENEAALAQRRALEDEMIESRSQLESLRAAHASLQTELEDLRTQADIWRNASAGAQDKMKQENQVLRNHMQSRLAEIQVVKSKLAEGDAERQRLTRDLEELRGKLQWLTKINAQLENSAAQLEEFRKQAAELAEKFMRERAVRRKLHEQLQQLRGNIRVMCRVRPVLPPHPSIVTFPLEGLLAVHPPDRRAQDFEFDFVFGPDTHQEAIYGEISPLVRSCADGYNVCIFAYGQTGSGKTFTMEGTDQQPGINVRALRELFSIGAEEGIDLNWKVQVSMLEIYNETVYDLLVSPSDGPAKALDVSGLGAGEVPPGAERVPGATWRTVESLEDVQQVLRDGGGNRSTAATALNATSSRSHAVLSVRVTAHAQNMSLRSMLHLVDLAGSERIEKSEVTGQQLKEAQSINKSLSALGDVISALQRRTPHIPFRNSKLTQVLQDSLTGSSKVLLVCNISPEGQSASETLSSLNFASRAAQVELGQARRGVERPVAAAGAALPPLPGGAAPERTSASLAPPASVHSERTSAGSPGARAAALAAANAAAGMKPARSTQSVNKLPGGQGPVTRHSIGAGPQHGSMR